MATAPGTEAQRGTPVQSEKTNRRKPPLGLMPPAWFLLSIVSTALLWWLAPVKQIVFWPWQLGGGVAIAAGVGLAVVADQQFKRHGTTVKPFQQSSALVTGGVFRMSRHPMYLGMVIALVGIAVAFGAFSPFIVPICFALFLHLAFVRPEERDMMEQLGGEYVTYKTRVRQWL
jgi:protein-S-isoprenylcysteine O-methyltransferase Ste14